MVSAQDNDGVMDGEQLEYYIYNVLKKKQLYYFGKHHGKQEFFDANGNLSIGKMD